jgi:ferritin-like metal-binding protein YciE
MEKTTSKSKRTASKDDASLLENFFVEELKDIYWAEKHLTKALPKMQKAATSEELANAFADHLVATHEHISRLEKVFEMLDKKPQAKKCDAMEGILKEGESIISETEAGSATRDVGLILAAQKAEHYEIATYGGLAQLAKTMGREDIKNLLGQTLDEEKECDELLTSLAEEDINETADQE